MRPPLPGPASKSAAVIRIANAGPQYDVTERAKPSDAARAPPSPTPSATRAGAAADALNAAGYPVERGARRLFRRLNLVTRLWRADKTWIAWRRGVARPEQEIAMGVVPSPYDQWWSV